MVIVLQCGVVGGAVSSSPLDVVISIDVKCISMPFLRLRDEESFVLAVVHVHISCAAIVGVVVHVQDVDIG